jgi:hypothetical protein
MCPIRVALAFVRWRVVERRDPHGAARSDHSCIAPLSCVMQSGGSQGCLNCGKKFQALSVTSVSKGLRPDIERFLATYEVEPCFGAESQAVAWVTCNCNWTPFPDLCRSSPSFGSSTIRMP